MIGAFISDILSRSGIILFEVKTVQIMVERLASLKDSVINSLCLVFHFT